MENNFRNSYREALKLIRKFHKTMEGEHLLCAVKWLAETINYNEDFIDAYIWLSYIFFVFGRENEYLRYLGKAEKINSEHKELIKLRQTIKTLKTVKTVKKQDSSLIVSEDKDIVSQTMQLYT